MAGGKDVTPGDGELKKYWVRGPGLARWASSPHPWTTLADLLTEHVGRRRAERMASAWFQIVFGIWPGERKGKNPLGPG